jgi:hypothetical protein
MGNKFNNLLSKLENDMLSSDVGQEVIKFLGKIAKKANELQEPRKAGKLRAFRMGDCSAISNVGSNGHFEPLCKTFTVPTYFWPEPESVPPEPNPGPTPVVLPKLDPAPQSRPKPVISTLVIPNPAPGPVPNPDPAPQPGPKTALGPGTVPRPNPGLTSVVVLAPAPRPISDMSELNPAVSTKFEKIIKEIPERTNAPWHRKFFAFLFGSGRGQTMTLNSLGKELETWTKKFSRKLKARTTFSRVRLPTLMGRN